MKRHQSRTIIIGDVHGCILELKELAKKIKINPEKDRIIFVGDLINKGPFSKQVYLQYKEWNAEAVLGNHEYHIIKMSTKQHHERSQTLKKEFGNLYNSFIQDIKTWPYYIEEKDFIVVHGGIVPHQNLDESSIEEITTIRYWPNPNKKEEPPLPWFEYYTSNKLVVFGHWAALEGVVREHVIGLDTGCVYGKKLSALVLPEKKIVSVPANQVYSPIKY